jgi:hypothetical protein
MPKPRLFSQERALNRIISATLKQLREERELVSAVIGVLEPLARPSSIERRARLADPISVSVSKT